MIGRELCKSYRFTKRFHYTGEDLTDLPTLYEQDALTAARKGVAAADMATVAISAVGGDALWTMSKEDN